MVCNIDPLTFINCIRNTFQSTQNNLDTQSDICRTTAGELYREENDMCFRNVNCIYHIETMRYRGEPTINKGRSDNFV
jgi:hypothetical protein